MENEEKSMETIKANVERLEEKYFIKIVAGDAEIKIPLSEDEPNEVKSAFNRIITRLKDGIFQIEMDEIGEDLFSKIADEYIKQLNREIQDVYGQMKEYGLVVTDPSSNEVD